MSDHPYSAHRPAPSLAPAPAPAFPSPIAPARGTRAWLLAGLLGMAGGCILLLTLPMAMPLMLPGHPNAELLVVYLAQALFGLGCVIAALLSAPGRALPRALGVSIVVVGLLLGFTLASLYMQGAAPWLPRGIPVSLLTSMEGWLTVSGAAAWLLASGARPWAWFTLIGALLVAPLRVLTLFQGLDSVLSMLLVYGFVLLVAFATLLVSMPRASTPPLREPQRFERR